MKSTGNEVLGQELFTFSDGVRTKYESFRTLEENLREEYEEKLQYKRIKRLHISPAGIVELLTLLCSAEVYQCSTNKTEKVQELKNKNVMLLISDLTFLKDDLITLTSIYDKSFKSSHYEIMWVPIADAKDDEQFHQTRSQMRWYSCKSIVSKAAAKFIRKHWQYKQQTKVVVLDQEGNVVNMDAMTMIRFWGLKALPFTPDRDCELWKEHSNNWLKLVVNNLVFKDVEESFEREELIFLYGSAEDSKIVEDIEIHLRTIKSDFPKFMNFSINTKRVEFQANLERCIFAKMKLSTELSDPLTQDLLKLFTRYNKQKGFGIITRGSRVFVHISLMNLEKVLSEHKKWITKGTNEQNFHKQFQDYYNKYVAKTECHVFKIPNMVGNIPQYTKCPKCSLNMEKVVTFKCCHGEH